MTSFPIGTAPGSSLAVFFVDPATGIPLNLSVGTAPTGQPVFPISQTPQEAVAVLFVDPTSGLPISIS